MSDLITSRRRAEWRNLWAVGVAYLLAGIVIGVLLLLGLAFTNIGARDLLATVTMGVGLVLMLTGGNLMERVTTLESSQWGISVNRHRDELGKEYPEVGQLTSVGLAILVGIPLVALGAVAL
ncbi:MAG TPA: hypothetical protein VMM13_13595 [Euzebya sp.]|nr:hypothetical protein [Euzebya sp.]